MSTADKLLSRLWNKEDNFTERKPAGVNAAEIRKTLVAFANSLPDGQTGVLYIGVSDNGTIAGVAAPDSIQKTVRKICEQDCYPPIVPSCVVLSEQEREIVAVEISPSTSRPHFSGPAFVRVGSETVKATNAVYVDLLTSHCSHAGQLLKLKGGTVTTWTINKVLGNPKPVASSLFNAKQECKVLEVTPAFVKLEILGANKVVSEPISNIQLSHDDEKHRPLLIIKPI